MVSDAVLAGSDDHRPGVQVCEMSEGGRGRSGDRKALLGFKAELSG